MANLKKTLLILVSVIIWVFLSNIIVHNNSDKNAPVKEIKSVKIIDGKKEYQSLEKYLIGLKGSTASWISRKEIAAWSATLLYLSVSVFVFKMRIFRIKKVLFFIYFSIFTLLILLFIHQQYGQMINSMASQRAINKYLYLLAMKDSSVVNFNFQLEENNVMPKSLADEINKQSKMIRKLNIYQRFFLPTVKLYKGLSFNKNNMSTVEIQEGVLYNIILLTFILCIITGVCSEKAQNNKSVNSGNRTTLTKKR